MEITASPTAEDDKTQIVPTTQPETKGTGKAGRPLGRHAKRKKPAPRKAARAKAGRRKTARRRTAGRKAGKRSPAAARRRAGKKR